MPCLPFCPWRGFCRVWVQIVTRACLPFFRCFVSGRTVLVFPVVANQAQLRISINSQLLLLPPPPTLRFFSNAASPRTSTADQQALQQAVRQRDLLGLSCLLSHGFGLNAPLIEGLVESCGPRGVQDCFLEAVASAR